MQLEVIARVTRLVVREVEEANADRHELVTGWMS
jgi:hypothetical protein